MKTLHPEIDVTGSRVDGADFVYTVRKNGREHEVRVPQSAFAKVTPGVLGQPARRSILAAAVRGK